MKVINIMLYPGLGGTENAFLDYNLALTKRGFEVLPIVKQDAKIQDYINLDYKTLPYTGGILNIISKLKLGFIFNSFKPDLIITHESRSTRYCSSFLNRLFKIPIINVVHGNVSNKNYKSYAKCNHVIAVSKSVRNALINKGLKPEKVIYIPNMIHIPSDPATYREINHIPVIGTMARFTQEKGVDVLLKSLSLLKKENFKFKAIIAGDGKEKDNYKSLTCELGLSNEVEFVGWVTDKKAFFEQIDLYCSTSFSETFGVTIIESMLYKVPVLSTKTLGPKEIIYDKTNGFLCDIGNPKSIAANIKIALSNEKLREQIVSNAHQKTINEYEFNIVANKINQFIHSFTNIAM